MSPNFVTFMPDSPTYTLLSGGVGRRMSMGTSSFDIQKKVPRTKE